MFQAKAIKLVSIFQNIFEKIKVFIERKAKQIGNLQKSKSSILRSKMFEIYPNLYVTYTNIL